MRSSGGKDGWSTVLCGFGSIAAGISHDQRMARFIKYQTHAQVLRDHPDFNWQAVVDPDPQAQIAARKEWGVPIVVGTPQELPKDFHPQIAVLTTPPEPRLSLLQALPNISGIIVEKPLGNSLSDSRAFIDLCKEKNIVTQVNLFRRSEETCRNLVNGTLNDYVGRPQAATVIYGNGLLNNGTHMIDLVRMLLGEITAVRAVGSQIAIDESVVKGDINVACVLTLSNGVQVAMHPIDFHHYREVAIDIWGERGRLEIYQEGLFMRHSPLRPHRALEDTTEVAIDEPTDIPTKTGVAFYSLYENFAAAMKGQGELHSPLDSALRSEMVVDAVLRSVKADGDLISLDSLVTSV